jgi:hypothetical protein
MNKIKFKFLFLIFLPIIFFFVSLYFETNLFKKKIVPKSNVQKVDVINKISDSIFHNYANFLINNRIINNDEIINFSNIVRTSSLITTINVQYISDLDLENYIKKIIKEVDYINLTIKKELTRYIENKTEFSLLDETTKLFVNYYKDKKDIHPITLTIKNEEIKNLDDISNISKIRFIFYFILSFVLTFILTFFLKMYFNNKKDFFNFFDKL